MNQPGPQPVAPAVAEPSALSAAVPLQDGQSLSLGLMVVGDAMVALPNAQLSEVVACPSRLHPLPLPVPGLRGSVDLRGLAVPVIDLRFLMGLAPRDADAPGAVIVIMRFDGNLLGLLVDRIVGIARVAPGDLVPLVVLQPAGARIASHSVLLPSGHATVLDAGRIAALPDLPLVPEPTISRARHRADQQALLVMHCAGFAVAIDALDIAATVSPMEIRPSALCSTLCRGVFTHQGHEIPVVDTAVLLGLGQRAEDAPTVVLVMPLDQGRVGLLVDQVRGIVQAAAADIHAVGATGIPEPTLLGGILGSSADSAPVLVLDGHALRRHPLLSALASMSQSVEAQAADRDAATPADQRAAAGGAAARVPYLVFRAGGEWAAPLAGVREIVPYPARLVALAGGRDAVVGLFTHRCAAIALVDLARLLGRESGPAADSSKRVLLVEAGGQTVGFVVQELVSIEHALWQRSSGALRPHAAGGRGTVIEIGAEAARRTVGRIDLVKMATELAAPGQAVGSETAGVAV